MANQQESHALRRDNRQFTTAGRPVLRPIFRPTSRPASLAFLLSLLVHGAAIGGLLTQGLFPPPPSPAVPLEVSWISPIAEPAPSLPTPIRPSPPPLAKVKPKPGRAPQPISVARDSSVHSEAVAQPVEAAPTETRTAEAAPSAAPPQIAQSGPASTTAPAAPITPAHFAAAYLRNPAPAYPAESRRRGEQGRILLRVHVLPDGLPDEIILHHGSGFERLDRAAINAVHRWKFVPAQQGGGSIAAWVIVPIQFSLQELG
jgi:periplasmic protein TonB